MQLFYSPTLTKKTKQFVFDKIESKHIIRVLRKKAGDELFIANGNQLVFRSKIIIANDKKCVVDIIAVEEKDKVREYYLHIAIAPTKNNDRLEWFLEKATEIGVDEITPILCEHSERKVIKEERLEKILIAAMKQSLKYKLPKLNSLIKFSDFIKQDFKDGELFIAHCEDSEKQLLKNKLGASKRITILIGPEGDFSMTEITNALTNKFVPISLGESRLRTETAGLVAVQTINCFYQ